jgi:hypothetical protein
MRKTDPQEMLTPQVFSALVAYVGEVMRHMTRGRWEMRLETDGQTWAPFIVDLDGFSYSPREF